MPKPDYRNAKTQHTLIAYLSNHCGRANAASAPKIAKVLRCSRRTLTSEVRVWRSLGFAVCGDWEKGFFMAETVEELREFCTTLRAQALTALRTEAKLRGVPCVDVLAYIAADLEKSEGHRIGIVKPASMCRREAMAA